MNLPLVLTTCTRNQCTYSQSLQTSKDIQVDQNNDKEDDLINVLIDSNTSNTLDLLDTEDPSTITIVNQKKIKDPDNY